MANFRPRPEPRTRQRLASVVRLRLDNLGRVDFDVVARERSKIILRQYLNHDAASSGEHGAGADEQALNHYYRRRPGDRRQCRGRRVGVFTGDGELTSGRRDERGISMSDRLLERCAVEFERGIERYAEML